MVRAIVDRDFEIDNGIAGQISIASGLNDAFLDGRHEVSRYGATEDFIGKAEFLSSFERLHANPAVAKLTVASSLLFVPALDLGGSANGFTVWDLRRLQLDIHSVPLLQPADDNLQMLLAGSRQEEFVRLRVTIEAQRRVLFEDSCNRRTHSVFVV